MRFAGRCRITALGAIALIAGGRAAAHEPPSLLQNAPTVSGPVLRTALQRTAEVKPDSLQQIPLASVYAHTRPQTGLRASIPLAPGAVLLVQKSARNRWDDPRGPIKGRGGTYSVGVSLRW